MDHQEMRRKMQNQINYERRKKKIKNARREWHFLMGELSHAAHPGTFASQRGKGIGFTYVTEEMVDNFLHRTRNFHEMAQQRDALRRKALDTKLRSALGVTAEHKE